MNILLNRNSLIRNMIVPALLVMAAPCLASSKPDWADKPLAIDADEKASPCDWLEFYAAPGKDGLKIAYRCSTPVNFSLGAAYSLYLDTDGQRDSGYRGSDDQFPIGADYLLQGGTLYRYGGHYGERGGTDWLWNSVGLMTYTISGEWAEFILTAEQMTITSDTIHVILVGDNVAANVGGNYNDEFPDHALSKNGGGRFIPIKTKKTAP